MMYIWSNVVDLTNESPLVPPRECAGACDGVLVRSGQGGAHGDAQQAAR